MDRKSFRGWLRQLGELSAQQLERLKARLADGEGQGSRRHGRVAIAELGRDLDVAGQARIFLEGVFAGECEYSEV